MALCGKACEGEESPDAPKGKAQEGEESPDAPAQKKRAEARSHLTPLHGIACECEESPDAPVRILSAFQISLDYYASCLRPYKVVFN